MLPSVLTVAGTGAVLFGLYVVRKEVVTNQEKLNAISTQLGLIQQHFSKGIGEVVNEIEKLRGQNADLDFSGLESAVSSLRVGAEALDEIVPDEIEAEEPAPAPEETPEESTPAQDGPLVTEPAPAPVPSDTDAGDLDSDNDPWGADDETGPASQETPSK